MYLEMSLHAPPTAAVSRGMALLHMSRLLTCSLGGEAHLNFIGTEFGPNPNPHPTTTIILTLAPNPNPNPNPIPQPHTPTPTPNQATSSATRNGSTSLAPVTATPSLSRAAGGTLATTTLATTTPYDLVLSQPRTAS